MTVSFVWHYIFYYIILTIIMGVVFSLLYNKINVIISAILTVIASFISVFLTTKLSTSDIFKKKELDEEGVRKFKRNMVIFFIICILLTTFYNSILYAVTIYGIDKNMQNIDATLQEQIKDVVEQAKSLQLVITSIVALIECSVYVAMIPLQRKYIKQYNLLSN